MIEMGLLNVLIRRLDVGIKDLKEIHNKDRSKRTDAVRTRDADEDIDMIFPKRVKIECTPPRFLSVINLHSSKDSDQMSVKIEPNRNYFRFFHLQRDIDSPPASSSSSSIYYSPSSSPSSSLSP